MRYCLLLLCVLMLASSQVTAQSGVDTGWRIVPSGGSVEEYFYVAGSTSTRLRCDWVLVRVAAGADSMVYLRRSNHRTAHMLNYLDAASQVYIEPGASMLLTGKGLNAMLVTRPGAVGDLVMYIGGQGEPPSYVPAAATVSIGTIAIDTLGVDLTSTNLILTDIDTKLAPGDTITTRLNQIGYWTRLTRGAVVTGNTLILDLETLLGAIEPDVDTLVTRATLANSRLNLLNTRMYQTRDNVAAVRDTLTTSNVWLERVRDAVNAISMSVNVDSLEIDFTATNAILSDSLTPTLTNELLRAIRDSLGTLDLGDISMSAVEEKLDSLVVLASWPEVRVLDDTLHTLVSGYDLYGSGDSIFAVALDVNGAVSVDLVLTWNSFTGPALFRAWYGDSGVYATDKQIIHVGAAVDSTRIVSGDIPTPGVPGGAIIKIGPRSGAKYLQGYLYPQLTGWSATDVDSLTIKARRLY